jgi:hypothetical protein
MFFASVSSAPPAAPLASMVNSGSFAWAHQNSQGQNHNSQGQNYNSQWNNQQ